MTTSALPKYMIYSMLLLALSACNSLVRLSEVGEPPKLSSVQNPIERASYQPVSMPMPTPKTFRAKKNSLWRSGSKSFFKDLRAHEVGDIVTVNININDSANWENTTGQARTSNNSLGVPSLLGIETSITDKVLPGANPSSLVSTASSTTNNGTGSIQRTETVSLQVAAVVTQILPNGNMVIHGRQETRVNAEVRELQVAGVIQPQDITGQNSISYQDIAEARVSYGGRGTISDVQQPRVGAQLIDILLPF